MTPQDILREGLGFGSNLTDEQIAFLVLERLTDLAEENRTLREGLNKLTLYKE